MSGSRKRARIEGTANSDASDTHDEMTRHAELWFDDGSIVLVAEAIGYRVHRSTLTAHSAVFADMFQLPQPPDQDAIEGCSVVHLSDSSNDLTCILKALYNPFFLPLSSADEEALPFEDVISLLYLSTKYDVAALRAKSIRELKKLVPCTLERFDALGIKRIKAGLKPDNVLAVINAARKTAVPELLPCAFYLLSQMTASKMFKFKTKSQGRFSDEDFAVCLLGRETLLGEQKAHPFSFLYRHQQSDNCMQSDTCIGSRGACEDILQRVLDQWLSENRHLEVRALDDVLRKEGFEELLCHSCWASMKSQSEAGRKEIWTHLPKYFGLSTWGELQDTGSS